MLKEKTDLNYDALKLRKELGEDLFSPVDIFSLMGGISNLTLVAYPLSERISGMCYRISNHKLIAINSNLSLGRQRFSVAHELYHLYYQPELSRVICQTDLSGKKDDEEKNADTFASYFLAPFDSLRFFVNDKLNISSKIETVEQVVRIEQFFGMSHQATLVRLVIDKYLSKELAETLKPGIIKTAARLSFDSKLYLPTAQEKQFFTTGSYINMTETLNEKGKISAGKYEELLIDAFRSDIVFDSNTNETEKYD